MNRFAQIAVGKISSLARGAGFAAAIITGFALASYAEAATILVDFGSNSSFRGVSAPGPDGNGNYWNSIVPGPYIPNMVDTTNTPTTIDLGFDTGVGTDSYNGPAGATSFPPTAGEVALTDIDAVALGNMGIKEAAFDFAAADAGPSRFQIQGLDPTKTYDLTFFASHKFSDNDSTTFSVFTDATYTSLVASTSVNVQTPGSPWLHNRDTLVTLSNLSPQLSNIFYVQFNGTAGGAGYLNDMRISEVPEPTGLAAFGVAALLAARRRRN